MLEEAILPSQAPHHEPVKILAFVTDYDTLHAALRSRKDELDLSCQMIDRAAALASGHVSKILAPQKLKNPGGQILGSARERWRKPLVVEIAKPV
jgi:hypothetical protein